jgi:orotate phosphoribosyltransferase|tara:strand:+ start:902 stop:1084 length:183 start_codon:yes stop_codon:yes gene_type:complete
VALAQTFEKDVPYCYNRKEAKDHGEGGSIVGAPLQGRVLVVNLTATQSLSTRFAHPVFLW